MNGDRWLGLFFCVFALALIFIWIPLDTGTGIVETVRRRMVIGDALAPTLAGVVLLLGGLLILFKSTGDTEGLGKHNVLWVLALIALFAISIALMRYSGSLTAALFSDQGYRPLRATVPWKYIGYLLGGTLMIGGLTSFVRGRILVMDWVVAVLTTLAIALIYDLPFDDLLLPPNGDV